MKNATTFSRLAMAVLLAGAAIATASCDKDKDEPAPDSDTITLRISVNDYDASGQNVHHWDDGDCIFIFDRRNPDDCLGFACHISDSEGWIFNRNSYSGSESRQVRIFHSRTYDSSSNVYGGYTKPAVTSSDPAYIGEGNLSVRNGHFNLSGGLRPTTARINFSGAADEYMLDYGIYSLSIESGESMSTLYWPNPLQYSGERSFYNNVIPRVKIGSTVYRYTGPEASAQLYGGQTVNLPFPTENPSLWESAEYVSTQSSLAQFNIYPSSSTKTILSGNLQSPIGFLVYLNYEWHPYSDISTNPDHNYPFVCRLYDGNNSYNDIILTELGTGNLEWTQSFSWSETSFSRMDFVADDYDVYVTVPKAIIANF